MASLTIQDLRLHHEVEIQGLIQGMVSLRVLPLPRRWWRPSPHLEDARWSVVLTRFQSMNARLGNRDSYSAADSVMVDGGRILVCPLCLQGPNDKVHLVCDCQTLEVVRKNIVVSGDTSLENMLRELRHKHPGSTSEDVLWVYLGQGHGVSRKQYIERGLALDILVDNFFLLWSKMVPCVGQRIPIFNWV